ncbi:putative glyoxalase/bleomycin resistance protein/dioxygenase [Mycobacterium xenopi 3993]|nr:putative glyoxalase/bleomycin resistance protein/dioxygenase [Mycobacterium xenopi 3993]
MSTLTAAGGLSCIAPMEVPAKGFMSLATDPSGRLLVAGSRWITMVSK